MKVLISGSSGLVGTSLKNKLVNSGHEVHSLVRSDSHKPQTVYWNIEQNLIEKNLLEGFDVVIHLAGESIASGRWTETVKNKIKNSRVKGTRLLCEALADCKNPPQHVITASAIGYYGTHSATPVDESSPKGSGFLAEVCDEWESATQVLKDKGVRVAHARFGVILSPKGGALQKMLLPFKMGVGGKIGSGKQIMSWIGLNDVVLALEHIVNTTSLKGPVNVVSPQPVSNSDFTKTLGQALHRPTLFPMPAFAAKLAFGEMADELLLSSLEVKPKALVESGFEFESPELIQALKSMIQS